MTPQQTEDSRKMAAENAGRLSQWNQSLVETLAQAQGRNVELGKDLRSARAELTTKNAVCERYANEVARMSLVINSMTTRSGPCECKTSILVGGVYVCTWGCGYPIGYVAGLQSAAKGKDRALDELREQVARLEKAGLELSAEIETLHGGQFDNVLFDHEL